MSMIRSIGIIVPEEPDLDLEISNLSSVLKRNGLDDVEIHTAIIPGEQSLTVSQILEKNANPDALDDAVIKLANAGVGIISYACTSGSFANGFESAKTQVGSLSKNANSVVTSTSLDMISAVKSLDVSRVYVLSAYPDELANAFSKFLTQANLEVIGTRTVKLKSGRRAFDVNWSDEFQRISELYIEGEFSVLLPHTTIDTIETIEHWEKGRTFSIITANAATLWSTLRAVDRLRAINGFGSLFQQKTGN